MVGASIRSKPLIAAAKRILDVATDDRTELCKLGLPDDFHEELDDLIVDLEGYLRDASIRKNDTSLQMAEVMETLVRIRAWLTELRMLASINLVLDAPSIRRVCSWVPEVADPYARDVLEELEIRISAANDLRARLEDVGLTERFLGRGKRLRGQLATAIGKEDLEPANLQLKMRRHYMKKGALAILLKRVVRAGQFAFRKDDEHAEEYHLNEVEPPEAADQKIGGAGALPLGGIHVR